MRKFDFTFSVTEGNMIHNALLDSGPFALARCFPHVWLYPVEDESSLGAVWDGDTSVSLTADERKTIVDALFARVRSFAEKGYETTSAEHSALARRIAEESKPDFCSDCPFFNPEHDCSNETKQYCLQCQARADTLDEAPEKEVMPYAEAKAPEIESPLPPLRFLRRPHGPLSLSPARRLSAR